MFNTLSIQQKAKDKPHGLFFQPKLTINQPGDAYEQEADAMADRVMRQPASRDASPVTFFKPAPVLRVQAKCAECEKEELQRKEEVADIDAPAAESPVAALPVQRKCAHCEEEEKKEQRKENGISTPTVTPNVEQVLQRQGEQMDGPTRSFMENGFGRNFSNVQIHNDAQAHQSSADVNALAYTHKNHVVFGAGQYQPGTNNGNRLLAHELTHVVQQNGDGAALQREPSKDGTGQTIEEMLVANSFETKWKKFTDATDSMMRSMYADTPVLELSGGPTTDPLYDSNKQDALAQVDDIFVQLQQSDVDAYTYGMDFAQRLRFLRLNDRADEAVKLYQEGAVLQGYMKHDGAPVEKDFGNVGSNNGAAQQPAPVNTPVTGSGGSAASGGGSKPPAPVNNAQQANGTDTTPPADPGYTPAEEKYIKDGSAPLPFEGDLIVKLPYQNYLMVAKGKPYYIAGNISSAVANGKVIFGYTNFVIIQDLASMANKVEKYYVVSLVTQGAVWQGEAKFSSNDFKSSIFGKEGEKPKIEAIFNRLNSTRNMQVMDVVLQDIDIYPNEVLTYTTTKKMVGALKNEYTASPEVAKEVFDDTDKLITGDKKSEAADKLAELNEAAFAFLTTDKKIEYIKLLVNAWTWQAQEKAIIEIFKSCADIVEFNKIKDTLKSEKVWDGSSMWDKMFADLDNEYWSLLVTIGMKFNKTTFTLSDFTTVLWEYVRNMSAIGVFINSNGEPEVIPNMLKEIESAAKGAINFLEGLWDGIVMLVSHPDKLVEGVDHMINLILNLQLVQIGYPPAIEYVGKVFTQISSQVVAGFRGLTLMGATDTVMKKVKWAIIWEVASWFIGVGEIKAALKSVQIGGLTEKALAVARIFSRAAGIGKALEETEMVARFEKLTALMVKESKLIKSEEEAMSLISKLNDAELEKLVTAMQRGDIPADVTLAQLAKQNPELEGLVSKMDAMEKLAGADAKVVMKEGEIKQLQNLISQEADPMFEKLLNKEKQVFEAKVKEPGNVFEVVDKEMMKEGYDVEVKVGDHTYRRKLEDGTWCRFSTKKCNLTLDNSAVNKQNPRRINAGTEPVGVEPRARGFAIEDAHLENLRSQGWKGLPDRFGSIDAYNGGKAVQGVREGLPVTRINGADVLSVKSTSIVNPAELEKKVQGDLAAIANRNTYTRRELDVFVGNPASKNLHLIFEKGFFAKVVDNKEVLKTLKKLEKECASAGVKFEWFVIPENGNIQNGKKFLKAMQLDEL